MCRRFGASMIHVLCHVVHDRVHTGVYYRNIHVNMLASKYSTTRPGTSNNNNNNSNTRCQQTFAKFQSARRREKAPSCLLC